MPASSGSAGRIMAAFVLHAASFGGLFVRLPEVQVRLALGEALYGFVLTAITAGALVASLTSARIVDAAGPRTTLLAAFPLSAVFLTVIPLATGPLMLAAMLFVFTFGFAAINIAINVEADRYEAATGTRIMSRCHGWWAVGFLTTSLAAAGAVRLGMSPFAHFVVIAVLIVAVALAALAPYTPAPPRPSRGAPRRFSLPSRGVMAIAVFALAGLLLEGATRAWAVIHLRDTFGASDSVAAMALPTIVVTQTAGRFLADGWIARRGLVPIARITSVVLLVGTGMFALAPTIPIAFLAALLIGAGIAIVQPQGFAASARVPGGSSAEQVAGFSLLTTVIGFIGPPLFGLIAEGIGLRWAFAFTIPLPLLAFAKADVLEPEP